MRMEKPRSALMGVDWASMTHAYGLAVDIPDLLHAVWSPDLNTRQSAYRRLLELVVDQGSRNQVSVAVVPFLIDVVADPKAYDRFAACQILVAIAIGDEVSWFNNPPDLTELRRTIQRQSGMTVAELKQEEQAWVAAAQTEEERRARAFQAEFSDPELERDEIRWALQAYEAVQAGVPNYVAALSSPDPAVRLYVAYLLAWFPEEQQTSVPALARLLVNESEAVVAATACIAAGLCGNKDDQALTNLLSVRLSSPTRAERWSAAIGLGRLMSRPGRPVVEELYACLMEATAPVPHWPFLGGDMSAMSAFTLRDLDPSVAPDRVDILVSRLTNASQAEKSKLAKALLDAVFPEGPIAGSVNFTDLDSAQQRAVLALAQLREPEKNPMITMLLKRFNLSSSYSDLRAWCNLPR